MRKPKRRCGDKRIGKKQAAFLAVMHGGMGPIKKPEHDEDRPVFDFDDEADGK